ncbi:amino acid synthesis family protein [Tardiphaga sp. vice352]|uniref:amino acid synthesis family protein n=1 Tax=unclassified Tardiphaga TaxID=2631404 RepID=UPI0011658629|nr:MULTISPECIES: amino acid synthesis family protein [unclassified Tardiphaga]MBC7585578.1 amino acid synthesis family protein [Tardiphaga sp.]QDM19091.1 amino acid synthesis family protein [Tardiphaga sp. vice278]QDM24072.1 amino acid synthesis family protein [Tardiphaga sp. vice154]QDM29294.1 amino acid synthesis family protein [Tardiphaga sp. vice304]QDM34393.1 amino acid synthesis family protein [Tardiphaga sp. vice352]
MKLNIRRTWSIVEDKHEHAGRKATVPVRKVAVVAVLENPYASQAVDDLGPLISASAGLGEMMGKMALQALGSFEAQSYGKGGLVGLNGEIEHAAALLSTTYADPLRDVIGGGKAWISSMVKVAPPGGSIDIPMNHRNDIYVRSHYDGMTLTMLDTPMPDEIAIIFCMASAGRIGARVGGLTHEDVLNRDLKA